MTKYKNTFVKRDLQFLIPEPQQAEQ